MEELRRLEKFQRVVSAITCHGLLSSSTSDPPASSTFLSNLVLFLVTKKFRVFEFFPKNQNLISFFFLSRYNHAANSILIRNSALSLISYRKWAKARFFCYCFLWTLDYPSFKVFFFFWFHCVKISGPFLEEISMSLQRDDEAKPVNRSSGFTPRRIPFWYYISVSVTWIAEWLLK